MRSCLVIFIHNTSPSRFHSPLGMMEVDKYVQVFHLELGSCIICYWGICVFYQVIYTFFSARTSPNFSQFPHQVKHVCFPLISCYRETRKIFCMISMTQRIIQTRSSIIYYLIDINIHTQNLLICNSGQYIYMTGLYNFFFVLQDLIDKIHSYIQGIAFQWNQFLIASITIYITSFF